MLAQRMSTAKSAAASTTSLLPSALASSASHSVLAAPRNLVVARRRRASISSTMSVRASASSSSAAAAPAPTTAPSTLSSTAVDAPGAAAAAVVEPEAAAPAKISWWKKHDPLDNIVSVSSVHDLLDVFAGAGDKLVLIDVYAEWCHACRGISQKVFGLARDRPKDLVLVKLDFDANKQLAKALGVRALPSFAVFRGADGKLDLFTAGPARAALLREKVELYGAPRCVLSGKIGGYEPTPELKELLEKQEKAAAGGAEEGSE